MENLLRSIGQAVRALARTPGFTLTVVLTFAFGIGANSAVLSVVDAVLLRPLAFPQAEQLVRLRQVKEEETPIAPGRLRDWSRLSSSFTGLSGYYTEDVSDTTNDLPERTRRTVVSSGFLEVLGVAPKLGRNFTESEYQEGAPAVVLISERYWRERFQAAPDVLSKTVRVEGQTFAIVGVMPDAFRFPEQDVNFWWPYPIDSASLEDRQLQWYTGIGRLKSGTTLEQAQADLKVVQQQLAQQYPETDRDVGIDMLPLKQTIVGGVSGSLWLLLGAVVLLLLIACTNIAALLLSRVAEREQQIAVRFALGASRTNVALQMLTETAVLAFAGAVVGLFVAAGATSAFRILAPRLPRLDESGFDARMFLYSLATAAVAALLCGLFPALRSVRIGRSLASAGRTQVASGARVQWLLVGAQVALSVTLLTGAGLLIRSFDRLARVDPGFDSNGVLAFRLSGNWAEETDRGRLVQRLSTAIEELGTLPGVESVTTAWQLPGVPLRYGVEFELVEGRSASEPPLMAEWRTVAPGYFDVTRIPLLSGERCRQATGGQPPTDVLVNRSFASRYFAERSVLGLNLAWEERSQTGRIVGVVGDARERGMDSEPAPTVYLCDSAPTPFPWFMLRTRADPMALSGSVRQRLQQLEPQRSVYNIAPLQRRIANAYAQERLRLSLLIMFGVAALSLTSLGVYGTLSYVVSLRRREVGLRMALGSPNGTIVRQFLLKALGVVAAACGAGLLLSLAFTRTLSKMLYGISPWDPLTFVAVAGIVIAVGALAALLPAMRASRVEPMQALRQE